jgi:hypothetical protein
MREQVTCARAENMHLLQTTPVTSPGTQSTLKTVTGELSEAHVHGSIGRYPLLAFPGDTNASIGAIHTLCCSSDRL